MKKKISILIIAIMAIITILPLGSAFAYTGGLLHGKSIKLGPDAYTTTKTTMLFTDGNTGTGEIITKSGTTTDGAWYEFDTPVNITDYQILADGTASMFMIYAVYADGTSGQIGVPTINGTKQAKTISNVKQIGFVNNSTTTDGALLEFDVFGTASPNPYDTYLPMMDGKTTDDGSYPELTDNDTATAITWKAAIKQYTFTEPAYIYSMNLVSDNNVNQHWRFYNGTSLIGHVTATSYNSATKDSNGNLVLDLNNVTHITLTTSPETTWVKPKEVEFYGTGTIADPIPPDITAPEEITDLTVTTTATEATFNWSNPADDDFSKVNIYQGTTLKGSSTNGTYTISGLTQGTEYTYTFKTVDSTGNESAGTTETINTKTDSDGDGISDEEDYYPNDPENTPKPAGEVAELVITPEYNKVKLSWKLPGTANFKNVTIYREVINQETGFLDGLFGSTVYAAALFETNGTTFTDLTVEPETDYEYTVKTNSVDGMESVGVTGTTTTPKKPLLTDLSLPFSVNELVKAGNELLWFIGPFLLLAMSFLLFPKLRKVIVESFRNNRKGKEGSEKDQAFRRFRNDEKEPKEKHEGKEHIEKMDKLQRDRQEREKREREARAAEPKIKEPRAPKESKRERRRAEKQMRISREPRAPREPRERTRAAREPGGRRRSS